VKPTVHSSPLDRFGLSPAYSKTLLRGLRSFGLWLSSQDHVPSLEGPLWKVDEFVLEYVTAAHKGRNKFHVTKHAVLALQLQFPRLRYHMGATWRALRRWETLRPWKPRVPVTEELMFVLFLQALDLGMRASGQVRRLWFSLAILIRIGFYGLLRPGEGAKLRRSDVMIIQPFMKPRVAVLAIASPKTQRVLGAGRSQFTTIRDTATVDWLAAFVSGMPPEQRLWPSSRGVYNLRFGEVTKRSMVKELGVTPASLRAGGATHELVHGESMENICFHGRWVNLGSLRSYLQEAASHLVWSQLSAQARSLCEQLLRRYRILITGPPPGWP